MVDFALLKERVTITQVADLYRLEMKGRGPQLRGSCPMCKGGGSRALAINTKLSSFYCFSARTGGDQISLAAHVTGQRMKESAEELARQFGVDSSLTVPPAPPQNGHHQFPEIRMLAVLGDRLLKLADSDHPEYFEAAEMVDDLIIKLYELK